jgi:peptidoglycan/LPS O-acetylase OafA/YrhL
MQFETVLQVVACVVTVLAFRAATVVAGLAGWQTAAARATWLVLEGRGSTLAGVLPLAMVLARGRALAASLLAAAAIILMTLWLAYPPTFYVGLADSHAVTRWTILAALPILVGCLNACLLWNRTLPAFLSHASGIVGVLVLLLPLEPSVHALVPVALHPLLSSAAIAAMMVFIIGRPHSAIVRLLEIRPLVYLGTLSYGIYVWQGILTGNGPYRQVPGWPLEPIVGAVLSIAVAALSYRLFEEPILRYKDRLGRPMRTER